MFDFILLSLAGLRSLERTIALVNHSLTLEDNLASLTLSSQLILIILNKSVILSHRRSTTVSLETYPLVLRRV